MTNQIIDWTKPIETVHCERNPKPVPCVLEYIDGSVGRIQISGDWTDIDDINEGGKSWAIHEMSGQFLTLHGAIRNVQEGDIWPDISAEAAIKIIEARGYTVTPPDPMIKDREFVAGMIMETRDHAIFEIFSSDTKRGENDSEVNAIMTYLRANKEKI